MERLLSKIGVCGFIKSEADGDHHWEKEKFKDKNGVHTALLIDHILENIFSNLSTEDSTLQTVRLVCKQWNRVAIRSMQKRPQLVVNVRKYNFWRLEEKCSQLIRQLKNFSVQGEFGEHFSDYPIPGPFVRFRLCQDIWKSEHECTIKKFFQLFSSYLVHLHIEIQQDSSLISLRDYFKTIKLQRLQNLIIEDASENTEAFVKNGRYDVVRGFLSGSVVLREVGMLFPKFKESPQSETDRIVTQFLHDIRSHRVRNLILSVKISDTLLTTLTELKDKFQLTHLQLFLQSSKFSGFLLTKLLQTQQSTLKALKLIDIREGCEFHLEFPSTMQKLEKLHIRGWHDSLKGVKFATILYQKNLPKLKSLHLDVPCGIPGNGFAWLDSFIPEPEASSKSSSESPSETPSTKITSDSVEVLRLPTGFNCVHFAKRIPSVFSKLSCLEINLTPFSMASPVFGSLECLKELKIFIQDFSFYVYADAFAPCRALDKMLTGIDVEVNDVFSKKKLSDIDDNDLMEVRRKPSLLALKNLERLEIKDLENRTIPLTDVTGYLAFLKMKNLRVLDVGSTLMRKDCLKKLAKKFPASMAVHLTNVKSKGKYKEYVTIQSGGSGGCRRYPSSSISGCSVQ